MKPAPSLLSPLARKALRQIDAIAERAFKTLDDHEMDCATCGARSPDPAIARRCPIFSFLMTTWSETRKRADLLRVLGGEKPRLSDPRDDRWFEWRPDFAGIEGIATFLIAGGAPLPSPSCSQEEFELGAVSS